MPSIKYALILVAFSLSACSGLDAAWRAQKAGNYSSSQELAARVLAKDPKNPEVYQVIAGNYLGQGKYDEAIRAAQFSASLAHHDAKSMAILAQSYEAKKDWAGFCETTQQQLLRGQIEADPQRLEPYRQALTALSATKRQEGYGCYRYLEGVKSGLDGIENAEDVAAAQAQKLAQRGLFKEAIAIEERLQNDDYRLLNVANQLFNLRRDDEAKSKVIDYLKTPNLSDTERLRRKDRAYKLCDAQAQWVFKAELLEHEGTSQAQIERAIALKNGRHYEASTTVLNAFFTDPRRDFKARKDALARLFEAALIDEAVSGFDASAPYEQDNAWLWHMAKAFDRAGKGQKSRQILQFLDSKHAQNIPLKLDIFDWLYTQGRWPEAQTQAEQLLKLGVDDRALHAKVLVVYGENRQFRLMQRAASQLIDSEPSPAADTRLIVARAYARYSDWQRAEEILRPLDEADALNSEAETFYIEVLKRTQNDARLFELLQTQHQKNTRSALEMASFFERPEAESYFLDSLKPLLDTPNPERSAAYYAKAVFYDEIMQNPQEVSFALAALLEHSNDLPASYKHVVEFYIDRLDLENAEKYAETWINFDPNARDPYAILGVLKLRRQAYESSEAAFKRYIDLSPQIYPAMRYVFAQHLHTSAGAQGHQFTKDYFDQRSEELDAAEKIDSLRAMSYADITWSHQLQKSDKAAANLLKAQGIARLEKLIELDSDERALGYASELASLGAYASALKAYDKGASSPKRSSHDKVETVRMSLLTGASPNAVQKRCDAFVDETEILALAAMLESEQALALGETSIERLLRADKAATRLLAFNYLQKLARDQADTKKLQSYANTLEASAPQNADIRYLLLNTAIEDENWDDATRHVNHLLMTRPDARNLIESSLIIARRAPEHAQAQAIWENLRENAKNVQYRSLWIAEAYQNHGDYQKAVEFYRLADAQTGGFDEALKLRRIGIEVQVGHQGEALNLVDALRSSPLWNAERIHQIAKSFHQAAYEDEAQSLMLEAIQIDPESTELKSEKLAMALDTGNIGKIRLSLEHATEAPVAEVMQGIVDRGAMLDAFEAIDRLEAQGQFLMAAASLLRVQDAYVQARGVSATRQKLLYFKIHAPSLSSDIDKLLAKNELMGPNPCHALARLSQIEDVELWGQALKLCKTDKTAAWHGLMTIRREMQISKRHAFDATLISNLAKDGQVELLMQFADRTGQQAPVYPLFQSLLLKESAHQALRYLEAQDVSISIVPKIISSLASFDYDNEAIELAEKQIDKAPEGIRQTIAIQALMLGARAPQFFAAIDENNPNNLDATSLKAISKRLSNEQVKTWIAKTPTTMMDKVIATAIFAARDDKRRDEILSALNADIDLRPQRASLLFSLAKHARAQGLDEAALDALYKIQSALPTSESTYRDASVILERMGRHDDAWKQLEKGDKRSANHIRYWANVRLEHVQSSLEYRQKINRIQRQLEPRNAKLALDGLELLLESQKYQAAETLALEIGRYKASEIASIYDAYAALERLPTELYDAERSLGLELKARRALLDDDRKTAAKAFAKSASLSAWPLESYRKASEAFIAVNAWDHVEQFAALSLDAYPHAHYPYLFRALVKLEKGDTKAALDDIREALRRELSSDPIFGRYLREVAEKNQAKLSQEMLSELAKLGQIHDLTVLNWLLPYFAKNKNAAKTGQNPTEFAKSCLKFLRLAKIDPVYTSQDSPENLELLIRIAQTAGDEALEKRAQRQADFID